MNRYVELTDVIDIVMQYCPDDDGSCSNAGIDMRDMLDDIENLPTVNPVVSGKWIECKDGMGFQCSVCKARHRRADVFSGNHNFCYKCGAKMEDNTMFYPQVEGITPTVIRTREDKVNV